MSLNILDAVRSYFTPDLISAICQSLNENDSGINKTLSCLPPVVLSGFATEANSNHNTAIAILGIAKEIYKDVMNGKFENINRDFVAKEKQLLQLSFGDKFNNLVDTISAFADVKRESVIYLFGVTSCLVAASLGKYAEDIDMDATGLSSFLHSQKTNIMSALPAGLTGITPLLGLSQIGDNFEPVTKHKSWHEKITTDMHNSKERWIVWVLFLAVMLVAVFYFAHKK